MTDVVLSTKPRFDVYQAVTDKIIEAIEAGAGEFVMPWHGLRVAQGRPANPYTHCVYRGVNILTLWAEAMLKGYRSRYWASYAQWKKINGQVLKGEKGTVIVFYKRIDSEPEQLDLGEPVTRWIARASKVFNADQVDWNPPWEGNPLSYPEMIEQAEKLISSTGATIRYGGDNACFLPAEDLILMPDRGRFVGSPTSTSEEALYSTLFHELTHWTGAPHRLGRDLTGRFGDEAYAAEELVAEFGAAFLCADTEVANQPRLDHAAYMTTWLQLLRRDARTLFTAASEARRAASHIWSYADP